MTHEYARTALMEKITFLEGHKTGYLKELDYFREKASSLERYVGEVDESIKSLRESLKALDG